MSGLIHGIADRVIEHDMMPRRVGFAVAPDRGDGTSNRDGPDSR